ncbi:hypothetical protein [Streptomyces sp. NPDC046887]|uniref:hypothetical protein n=1 Tax=Streptomyces sp. NPDC046887 TaxID=3155472 RepID=UPI003401DFF7
MTRMTRRFLTAPPADPLTDGRLPDVGDAEGWIALDAEVRWRPWEELPADRGRAASTTPATPPERPELLLCHHDGRIREAALPHAVRDRRLLPLLVIRCADWAPPVRARARELFAGLLQTGLAAEAMAALAPVALRMARGERGVYVRDAVVERLRAAPYEVLAPLLSSEDRVVRRFAWRLVAERRLLGPAEFARSAAEHPDQAVRTLCADAALAVMDEGAPGEVLGPLLASRLPMVRSAGVTALRRAGRVVEAEPYLLDRSGLVRACARYVLRSGGAEPVLRYREWCVAGASHVPPVAPLGLAECGERRDAELLRPLLDHPVAGVRARAVVGLRLLDATGGEVERLRALLDDPAAGVVREAVRALLPYTSRLDPDWLLGRVDAALPRQVRQPAFRLLLAQGRPGVCRAAALRLADDPLPKLRERAARVLREHG